MTRIDDVLEATYQQVAGGANPEHTKAPSWRLVPYNQGPASVAALWSGENRAKTEVPDLLMVPKMHPLEQYLHTMFPDHEIVVAGGV